MKTIYFVREPKTWGRSGCTDLERKLTARGKKQIRETAWRMSSFKTLKVDCILTAPSSAGMHTAKIFMSAFQVGQDSVRIDESLYDAGSAVDMLTGFYRLDDSIQNVVFIGKNPALKELVTMLAPDFRSRLTRGSIAGIAFDIERWIDLPNAEGACTYYDLPNSHYQAGRLNPSQREFLQKRLMRLYGDYLGESDPLIKVDREKLLEAVKSVRRLFIAKMNRIKREGFFERVTAAAGAVNRNQVERV
jgi:phosphohistidine phosphatase SixA